MPDVLGIDHIYLSVSELSRSEAFYDTVLCTHLGFRKNTFTLSGDPHVQYYNRHFGVVIRPARGESELHPHDGSAPGLHHLCFRVASIDAVVAVATVLQEAGIAASAAAHYPQYAPDYWATFFLDPDGIELEVTNYRQERRDRHDHWDDL